MLVPRSPGGARADSSKVAQQLDSRERFFRARSARGWSASGAR